MILSPIFLFIDLRPIKLLHFHLTTFLSVPSPVVSIYPYIKGQLTPKFLFILALLPTNCISLTYNIIALFYVNFMLILCLFYVNFVHAKCTSIVECESIS